MLGLLQPKHGTILIDGIPLAQLGLAQYRGQIAAVMQDGGMRAIWIDASPAAKASMNVA